YLSRDHDWRQARLGVRTPALHALRPPGLRLGVPDHGAGQDAARPRGVQRIALHWLPRLHAGLPVHYSEIRLREVRAEDPQMHVLRRPLRDRTRTGMRKGVPDRRDHLRRPRRHGGRSEATDCHGPGHVHPRNLRSRRGRRYQCPASVVGAVRADRLHYRPAEDADARPHTSLAAPHGARLCAVVQGVWRAKLDRAAAHAPPGAWWRCNMKWRIRLTCWDILLLAIMAFGAGVALVRFASGIGSIANINNAYPWGWWVGYGIMTMIAMGGVGFTITALVEIL